MVIALVEIFFFRKERFITLFKNYKTYLVLGGLFVASIVVFNRFGLDIFNPIPPNATAGTSVEITPLNYLFTQFSVIVKYILMLFIPIGQNLDHDYPVSLSFFDPLTILSFIFLSLILAFSVYIYNKNRLVSFAIIYFFVSLSIESSIIPISDVIFEHRTYLPSIGFFIVVVAGLYSLLWHKNRKILFVLLFLPILIFSYLTYQRNKVWKTDFSLWSDVIEKSPEKPRAYINRGMVYNSAGELELAFADYSKAKELDPTFSEAWLNCGTIYGSWNQNDSALICFNKAVQLNPDFKLARWNRGVIHGLLGNWEKAILDYNKVIELDNTFANVFYNRGVAYSNLSKWEFALKDFLITVKINPQYPNAYFNCAVAYDNLGDMMLAEEYYTKAIAFNPNDTKIYFGRAVARMHNEKWQEALQDFNIVLQNTPNYPNAKEYYNMVLLQLADE
ncbi:MAG: tetratricopeptide repeat protein [Bacteroidales bacterium]|nr:tetratricopeptide repeat protein [Bacteroidales bacterium]